MVTLPRARRRILRAMAKPRNHQGRAAFSLVELLVALTLVGVSAAGLAVALAGDRRVRDLAAAHAAAAALARGHLEALATRTCGADTLEARAWTWGTESWHATAVLGAWHLTDSLARPHGGALLLIEARVACPE